MRFRNSDKDWVVIEKDDNGSVEFDAAGFITIKATRNFRIVENTDDDYAVYAFATKSKFNEEHIQDWIDFLKTTGTMPMYLIKPFPAISVIDKITILNEL